MRDKVLRNTIFLLANVGFTMGLGFVFWWVAARLLPTSDVGLGSAVVSAMMLLGLLGKFGFDVTLVRLLPRSSAEERTRTLDTFATGTVLLATLLGGAFLVAAHLLELSVADAIRSPAAASTFLIGVVAVALLTLLDGLFLSRERAELVTWKNGAAAALKVVLLVPLAFHVPGALSGAWAVASLLTLCGVGLLIARSRQWQWKPRIRLNRRILADSSRVSAGNFVVQVSEVSSTYLLPLLVVQLLGPTAAGLFYIAWMVATVLNFIPITAALSFYSSASRYGGSGARAHALKKALAFAGGLLAFAALVAWFGGEFALGLFGPAYAEGALPLLRVLILASPLAFFNFFWTGVLRANDRAGAFASFSGGIALATLALSTLLAETGLTGIGWAWFAANALFACWSVPGLFKTVRERRASKTAGGRRPDPARLNGAPDAT